MLRRCVVLVAVNVYHTSSSVAFKTPHEGVGAPKDAVALMVLPAVVTPQARFEFTVRLIAPAQSSFPGGGGGVPMQILKVEDVPTMVELVYTRT